MTGYFSRLVDQSGVNPKLSGGSNSDFFKTNDQLKKRKDSGLRGSTVSYRGKESYDFPSTENDVESLQGSINPGLGEQFDSASDREISSKRFESSSTTLNEKSPNGKKNMKRDEQFDSASDREISSKRFESSSTTLNEKSPNGKKNMKRDDIIKTITSSIVDKTENSSIQEKNTKVNTLENNNVVYEKNDNIEIKSPSNQNQGGELREEETRLLKSIDNTQKNKIETTTPLNQLIADKLSPNPTNDFDENLRSQLSKIREWMTESGPSIPDFQDHSINEEKGNATITTSDNDVNKNDTMHDNDDQNLRHPSRIKEKQQEEQYHDKIQDYSLSIGTISIVIEAPSKAVHNDTNFSRNKGESLYTNNNDSQTSRLSRYYLR